MTLTLPIGRLRLVAILEGISYLLLFITMPIKYVLGIPEPNYVVGMAHGVLFIVYLVLSFQCLFLYTWGWKNSLLVLGASLIPFGTFYIDHTILKAEEKTQTK